MKDGRTFLKIKLKSLAAEARIIRIETGRARDAALKNELADHRRGVVRSAARNTALAYAFIRGRTYQEVETKAATPPDWKDVERMVKQYGLRWQPGQCFAAHATAKADEAQRFAAWMKDATASIQASALAAMSP